MIVFNEFTSLTNAEVVQELGKRFRTYRINYRLSQVDVCTETGMSVATLSNFENGKLYNLTLQHFIALMRILNRLKQMENLLPDIPISAYEMEKIMKKKPKRIRKNE